MEDAGKIRSDWCRHVWAARADHSAARFYLDVLRAEVHGCKLLVGQQAMQKPGPEFSHELFAPEELARDVIHAANSKTCSTSSVFPVAI